MNTNRQSSMMVALVCVLAGFAPAPGGARAAAPGEATEPRPVPGPGVSGGPGVPGGPGRRGGPGGAGDRRLSDTVELYMFVRMKEEVGLTEDQEKALLPLIRAGERERKQTEMDRRGKLDELRAELARPAPSETAIKDGLSALKELDRRDFDRRRDMLPKIADLLSVEQQARFVLFVDGFPREMRDRMREVRRLRGEPADAPPDSPPADPGPPQ